MILAAECVKATFFMVGEMAKTFPAEARRVKAEGHTVGTHSFQHPFTFGRMSELQAGAEIDRGIDAVAAALGSPDEVAPFFRVPGFLTSNATEAALASRKLMTWSADFPADDWKGISSAEIVKRAISRIEAKGRGILVLHDIHEQTVEALPNILSELKQRGYKIVQVVPASATVAKTQTTPEEWRLPHQHAQEAEQDSGQKALVPSAAQIDQSKVPASKASESQATVKKMAAPGLSGIGAGKLALGKGSGGRPRRFVSNRFGRRRHRQHGCLICARCRTAICSDRPNHQGRNP